MGSQSVTINPLIFTDGSFDWMDGVDSSKPATIQSTLVANGLKRSQLAWLNNATVRGGSIRQRWGWQPIVKLPIKGRWQGGFMYEPDEGYPYLVCSISGHIYRVDLDTSPPTFTELNNTLVAPWTTYGNNTLPALGGRPAGLIVSNPQYNPDNSEMVFFCQAENFLVIQAGDYETATTPTLPLIWDGTRLRRSVGLTTFAPTGINGENEIPAATCMCYYGNRLWYAQLRQYSAGDIVGSYASGTAAYGYRDSVLNVTENPLAAGGDGFTLPTNAGNIRWLGYAANINETLGQGTFYQFTRKAVYSMTVPTTRDDWKGADTDTLPQQKVVQLVNGAVGHRCVIPINGDLFYQSFEPSVRSLMTAVRYFDEWGNTPIGQNEDRAFQFNDRSLMRFSGAIEFDNRILNLILPETAADGINVIHKAIAPLDFDVVTSLQEKKSPAWEGAYDGLDFLELFVGDFGGLPRAFGSIISRTDGSIQIWELTTTDRFQGGDNRVTWGIEFPSFTWATSDLEFDLKQLNGGECWIDKVAGEVEMMVYYRPDSDPCWRKWFRTKFCAARCEDLMDSPLMAYPCEPTREGYKFPVVFPEPKADCDSMGVRPSTIGYQFQVKIIFTGWCRVRGLILHALEKGKQRFLGVACQTQENPVLPTMHNPFES
jgi:hypothetical protein